MILRKYLLTLIILWTTNSLAESSVLISDAKLPFYVTAPTNWIRVPTGTQNSKVKFTSPDGTPAAICAVIVQFMPSLQDRSQYEFDQYMASEPDSTAMQNQLAASFNNVQVFNPGTRFLSGHPAQLFNVRYSTGTTRGEFWERDILVVTMTKTGITWTISCGSLAKSPQEANKAYSYWQDEIQRFSTNLKIIESP